MLKEILNSRKGFTLTELLLSVTILAFVTVSVLLMTTMFIKSNSHSKHLTQALQLAEDGVEILRRVAYSNPYQALPGATDDLLDFQNLTEDFGTIPRYGEFRREFRVTFTPDISTLTVTVFWRNMNTTSAPIVLSTQRVAQ
jgi:prepilin-type N-terminal cleavage/methylation domain-containing protein